MSVLALSAPTVSAADDDRLVSGEAAPFLAQVERECGPVARKHVLRLLWANARLQKELDAYREAAQYMTEQMEVTSPWGDTSGAADRLQQLLDR